MTTSSSDSSTHNARLTQAERTALSDRRMLDAAIDLICTHGTHQTTLQALGKASGYSRGLVTYRFGSKAGLFEAVVRDVSQQWLQTLNEAVGDMGGLDAVIATADAYYRFVRHAPMPIRAMNILFCEAAIPNSPLAPIVDKINAKRRAQLEAWISEGQGDGTIVASLDPEIEAARFMSYVTGMTVMWLLSPDGMPFARAHESFKDQLIAMYTPGGPAPDAEHSAAGDTSGPDTTER